MTRKDYVALAAILKNDAAHLRALSRVLSQRDCSRRHRRREGAIMTTWKTGAELAPAVQADALRRFVHRMTVENVRTHRDYARMQQRSGYRCALLTDSEWLARSRFAVRKDGALSARSRYCESPHGAVMTREEFAAQLDRALGVQS
jgi:hypothetical protein